MQCDIIKHKKEPDHVTLKFLRDNLVYDIENICYVEGDIAQGETEHDKHQVFDVAQDGNVDRATRVMELAYNEAIQFLFPYVKTDIQVEEVVDDLKEEEAYIIDITLPRGVSETTIYFLATQIHEYITTRVVADWLSITKPTAAPEWEKKSELAKSKIKSAIVCRTYGLKRKLSPF